MQSFTLITLILVIFFLARQIRLILNFATDDYIIGALFVDVVIAGLLFFYLTYSLGFRRIHGLKLDRVKLSLLAILAVAFLNSIYLLGPFNAPGQSIILQAFSSFRKVFMPLSLLFLFSYLIKNEILRNGGLIFKRLTTLFTVFLWVAMAYTFLELTLRTTNPEFNSFYLGYYLMNGINMTGIAAGQLQMEDHTTALAGQLTGLAIKRVYSIQLDYHVTGGIIFLCYLFHVFMSGRFKVFSILNGLVFFALLLVGSLQFIVPFLALNAAILVRRYRSTNFLGRILVVTVLAGGTMFLVKPYILPTAGVSFVLFADAINPVKENLGLFVFGAGPREISLIGPIRLVGESESYLFALTHDIGFFRIALEVGLIMLVLFVLFHIIVLKGNGGISGHRQVPDQYTKGLKIMIVLSLVVTLIHQPVLFDRPVIVFHIFFVALLYSWSKYRMTSRGGFPAG
jgi:hypothetical protein